MRISDWSSYVCSSDLAVAFVVFAFRSANLSNGGRDGYQVTIEFADASGLTAGTDVRPRHPGVRRGPRSEEHTSELQSLMRISYAGFCLKKKKTNNEHH